MQKLLGQTLLAGVLSLTVLSTYADNHFDPNRILETYGYSASEPAVGKERGRQVYVQWCAICHESGPGMAGTDGLKRKYKGELPALLTEREDLQADYIEYIVRNGIASMPFFRKVEISDEDLEALNLFLVKDGVPTKAEVVK